MIVVARIEKQSAAGAVPRIGAPQDDEHILMAIIFEIGKGNGVPLLQVSEASGRGYVLKKFALGIAEHAVGNNRRQTGIAGSEVKIEPAIIIQIAKIGAHGKEHTVQMRRLGNVGKSPIMVVVVELGAHAFVRQTKIVRCDRKSIAGLLNVEPGNKNIFPTVIVVVEEPGGKTELRFSNAGAGTNFAEFPMSGSIRAIVVKELVGTAENGNVEVRAPIVIVIRAGDSFDEIVYIEAAGGSAFCKSSIMIVVE